MVIVSACLAGVPCRWDGGTKPDPKVVELLARGEALPVCPEQLGGLPTPRSPSELREGRVVSKEGVDVTERFQRGAAIVLEIAKASGCATAILKSRSPSCGCGLVYDGSFSGALVRGDGVTAALLKRNGIEVSTEEA